MAYCAYYKTGPLVSRCDSENHIDGRNAKLNNVYINRYCSSDEHVNCRFNPDTGRGNSNRSNNNSNSFCNNCGQGNSSRDNFCSSCGDRL